jgi:hypothetical protein
MDRDMAEVGTDICMFTATGGLFQQALTSHTLAQTSDPRTGVEGLTKH